MPSTSLIGAANLEPPVERCIRPQCTVQGGGLLAKDVPVECRLFTLRRGVLPVHQISSYCSGSYPKTFTLSCITNLILYISLQHAVLADIFRSISR